MPEIAIRCNASVDCGMGHAVRQLHLGKVLRDHGARVHFFISDFRPAVDVLKREGFAPFVVRENQDLPTHPAGEYHVAILDLLDTQMDFIQRVRQRTRKVVSFEDLGEGRGHVDLLIDSNLAPEQRSLLPASVHTLFGLAYSVLNPEFERYHDQPRRFTPALQSVLVSLGGTDPNHLTVPLLQTLVGIRRDVSFTVLVGPGFQDGGALERIQSAHPSVRVVRNISNLAPVLADHQAVFCSGGVTLHEALAVGTPAFVISQVPHQQDKALVIEKHGAAVDLGLGRKFDPSRLRDVLKLPGKALEEMSRAGKRLIDGRGIHRVAGAILQLARNLE